MQPSLLDWNPPCRMTVFPMSKRVGRIRDVAVKMLDKPTERAAAFYRGQVTDRMLRQMEKIGISEADQDEQIGAFWQAVANEMARLTYCSRGTGGAA